jgi:UDP-N-acetylmuramoyl-tripeptide--D-alanyl-D-alanine ligase
MPLAEVAESLGAAVPASRWRMELSERADGVLVVNDAYNANPESMRAALQALAALSRARAGRPVAVLGPMAELGASEARAHEAIGQLAAQLGVARLVVVGAAARPILRGAALEGSWNGDALWVPDVDAAVTMLRAELRPGDIVLVKASRAASLERVALAVAEDRDAPTDADAGGSA